MGPAEGNQGAQQARPLYSKQRSAAPMSDHVQVLVNKPHVLTPAKQDNAGATCHAPVPPATSSAQIKHGGAHQETSGPRQPNDQPTSSSLQGKTTAAALENETGKEYSSMDLAYSETTGAMPIQAADSGDDCLPALHPHTHRQVASTYTPSAQTPLPPSNPGIITAQPLDAHSHAGGLALQLDDRRLPDFMANIGYPSIDMEPSMDIDLTCDQDCDEHTPIGSHGVSHNQAINAVSDFAKWPFPSKSVPHDTAVIYDTVKASAKLNHEGPCITLQTTLNLPRWRREVTGHHEDGMVITGITYGFPIQYNGPPRYGPSVIYNHASAVRYPDHVRKYINTEVAQGALDGPYTSPPFTPWYVVSPLMTREKQDSDSRRIIVDLSYPEGGVNAHIRPHVFNGMDAIHTLPTINSATATVAGMCPGDVHMAVIDLSRAYRQFPVTPTDWPLLGIGFEGRYYFDRRIPFGSRMSSFVMQVIAQFIVRALAARKVTSHMYLDDLVIIAPTRAIANRDYHLALALLQELGLQVAEAKLQPPSQRVRWLGIDFNIAENQISIPDDKLRRIKRCMATVSSRTSITRKHLQRVIGMANHLAKVVRAARIFICRLLAALRAAQAEHIRVGVQVKADLKWFSECAARHNGRAIIPSEVTVKRIWADACLVGAGASDRQVYYSYVFTKSVAANHSITQLEALNCLAAVRLMVTRAHAGGTIQVHCDNQPAVDALTSGRARNEVLAACARAVWRHAAETDTQIRFTHVPGEAMALPDALSRVDVDNISRQKAQRFIEDLSLRHIRVTDATFAYSLFL